MRGGCAPRTRLPQPHPNNMPVRNPKYHDQLAASLRGPTRNPKKHVQPFSFAGGLRLPPPPPRTPPLTPTPPHPNSMPMRNPKYHDPPGAFLGGPRVTLGRSSEFPSTGDGIQDCRHTVRDPKCSVCKMEQQGGPPCDRHCSPRLRRGLQCLSQCGQPCCSMLHTLHLGSLTECRQS